ncbi:Sec-independent protein translocase TatB, partial [Citrobacter freundii]
SPEQKPESTGAKTPEPTENTSATLMDAEKKAAAPVVESSPSSSDKP